MIRHLYYLLPVVLIFGVLTRITIFPTANIYLWDFIVFFITLISSKKIFQFIKKRNIFVVLFFIFSIIGLVGLIVTSSNLFEFISSTSYLLRLGFYLAIIIPLFSLGKSSLNILKKIMLVSGLVFVFLGYIQYFYYPNLRNLFYLGWDDHLYRLFSTFLDPNFAGIFIVLIILFYSVYFFEKLPRSNSNIKIFLTLGYLFIIPSLFLTYSRSSLISGSISILLFLFLIGRKKIILGIIFIFMVMLFLLPKDLGGEGVNLFRTYSTGARLAQYNYAIQIFKDNPIIGVGFNSLRFVSSKYGFVEFSQILVSHSAAGIPNSFLVILSTTGVLGLTVFLVFIFKLVINTWTVKNKLYSSYLISMLSAVLVDSLFENALLFSPVMLWLVLSFGILYRKKN